jgi:hypothetical protein
MKKIPVIRTKLPEQKQFLCSCSLHIKNPCIWQELNAEKVRKYSAPPKKI